jgi:hypothetical protein
VAHPKLVVFPLNLGYSGRKTTMFYPKIHEQTILEISQGEYISQQPIPF